MKDEPPDVERDLNRLLQALQVDGDEQDVPRMTRPMPSGLTAGGRRGHTIAGDAKMRAWRRAVRALAEDPRFEHLTDKEADEELWRFACEVELGRKKLIGAFVKEHAKEPQTLTCLFPIELLTLTRELNVVGTTIVPAGVIPVPAFALASASDVDQMPLIAVEARGTNPDKIVARAREIALLALAALRSALRADRYTPQMQLRFQLSNVVWFENDLYGRWSLPPSAGVSLALDDAVVAQVESEIILQLSHPLANEVERHAGTALRWFERAQLETDPMARLLYLFYAFEAILGDRSEGLKGANLAIRRSVLGGLMGGKAPHPSLAFLLYDQVRSAAIHGEGIPDVSDKQVDRLSESVRVAIGQFVQFSRDRGLSKRSQVVAALESDVLWDRLRAELIKQDPKLWRDLGPKSPPEGEDN